MNNTIPTIQSLTPGPGPSQRPSCNTTQSNTVVLFGEVLADIFPERTVLGGAPFNVAFHLQAFEQNPVLITRLGDDTLGDEVLGVMSKNGMETLGLQFDKSHPTGQVLVHIDDTGHHFDILPQQAYDFIHSEEVRRVMPALNPALVYFGTLAQRNDTSEQALQTLLLSTGATKFLDVNLRSPWYDKKTLRQSLRAADIAKLNVEELGLLAAMFALPGDEPQDWARHLIRQFALEQVLVTCGVDGAWQMDQAGNIVEARDNKRITTVADTVGAGDGFAAVCILGILRRWPTAQTLERANSFAAAICEIRGAIPDQTDFYRPYSEEWTDA